MTTITAGLVIAPLPHTERGFGVHLGGTLKKVPRLLYCSSNLVIQRELENLNNCRISGVHGYTTTVAKFSPNGEWICSGDDSGVAMVWAHQSFVIKNTIQAARKVTDIAWSFDGQRIFAVGSGKDEKAKVFPWNTNNKLGEISGAQKGYLACDFKPNRPFRVISSSEDFGVYFFKGPPFRFETYDKTHNNFVNSVRYNAAGTFYISVSSDKGIHVFDGKTGKKIRDIKDKKNGHKGTIYEISWNPDDTQFVTSSADKTCKLWDFAEGKVIHTFKFADKPTVSDMQVSCYWLGDWLMSLSLSGKLNFLKPGEERPVKVLTGHRKPISDLVVDRENGFTYTCDPDSRVVRTECKTGDAVDFIGNPHKGTQIKFVRLSCDNKTIITVGVDDQVVRSSTEELTLSKGGVKLDGATRCIVTGKTDAELTIAGTHKNKLIFLKGIEITSTKDLSYTPTSVDISSDDQLLAVGGEDKKLHIYNMSDMNEIHVVGGDFVRQEITCVAFSPNGKFVASADKNRHIWVWEIANLDSNEPVNKSNSFQYHNAAPTSIEWSPDSAWIVSTGHDKSIFVWLDPTSGKNTNCHLDNAFHAGIRRVSFVDKNLLVGAAIDCTIRFFDITT